MAINHYKIFHPKSKKAIIFLHGWGGDYKNFEGFTTTMSAVCTVVNVSFFDCIESYPLTLDDYSNYVDDIIKSLRSSNIEHIILVGHSFGGRVAIRLASIGRVESIVLIDSGGMKARRGWKYIARVIKYKTLKLFKLNTINCGSSDYISLPRVRQQTFSNIVKTFQEVELARITIPTWIFWGDKDNETPLYMSKRILKGIKGSSIYISKGSGHYSYIDDSLVFVSGLTYFINNQ